MARTLLDIETEIESVCAVARARQAACQDVTLRGLLPAEADWMTTDELRRLTALQMEWSSSYREGLPGRLAEKRAARRKANQSE